MHLPEPKQLTGEGRTRSAGEAWHSIGKTDEKELVKKKQKDERETTVLAAASNKRLHASGVCWPTIGGQRPAWDLPRLPCILPTFCVLVLRCSCTRVCFALGKASHAVEESAAIESYNGRLSQDARECALEKSRSRTQAEKGACQQCCSHRLQPMKVGRRQNCLKQDKFSAPASTRSTRAYAYMTSLARECKKENGRELQQTPTQTQLAQASYSLGSGCSRAMHTRGCILRADGCGEIAAGPHRQLGSSEHPVVTSSVSPKTKD